MASARTMPLSSTAGSTSPSRSRARFARRPVDAIGELYEDADGFAYLPLLVQPLLVLEASGDQLRRARSRAASRGVALAVYPAQMFSTDNDAENRAAVRAVTAENLDLVGIGIRANHRDADAVLRGLRRHT